MTSNQKLIESFIGKRVMVVGDVMIDSYLWGVVDRISPEAPVPVVDVSHREERLGGAANVALNVKALGAEAVLCSMVGTDFKGDAFLRMLKEQGLGKDGIGRSKNRITTTKFRIIGNNSQLLRVDEENTHDLDEEDESVFLDKALRLIEKGRMDVMIIQDYNKGILTPRVIRSLIETAKNYDLPVVVDPKKKNFELYKDVTLFKPNLKELKEGLKIEFTHPDEYILADTTKILCEQINASMAMVTLSEFGVFISGKNNGSQESYMIPAHTRNIADVSGAGDTVVSVASLSLASGAGIKDIATISNLAGGLVCEKIGVAPINRDHLVDELAKLGG